MCCLVFSSFFSRAALFSIAISLLLIPKSHTETYGSIQETHSKELMDALKRIDPHKDSEQMEIIVRQVGAIRPNALKQCHPFDAKKCPHKLQMPAIVICMNF